MDSEGRFILFGTVWV